MTEYHVADENKVFVNRTLNMNHIKLIGFDMDYTLATYNVPAFEARAYEIVQDKLINEYGYPAEIKELNFDSDFIIRGLVIDTETGNILKVNRFGFVRKASHGTHFFSFEAQREYFGTTGIDLTDPRYYIIHTLFSLAEGCLYAQLVDFFDKRNGSINYKKIFSEVRKSVNDAHQEDILKGDIVADPKKYLIQDARIVEVLKTYKKYGKKLAMITNSDYDYSAKIMEYCFEPFLDDKWQDLFDLIIVASAKPNFFLQRQRFLKVDPESGLLSNFYGSVEWGGIYQGGNANIIEKHLELSPSEILYMGDHILGDVVTLKETIGWRTGLVVQELAEEVPVLQKSKEIHKSIAKKMHKKEALEWESLELREQIWGIPDEKHDKRLKAKWYQVKDQIKELDAELRDLIHRSQEGFNPYWGEIMRAGNELSRFATLVERYACVYMAGIANLSYYSPFKYFRSQRRLLAHDPRPDYKE